MTDYSSSKIYKITCDDVNLVYYGSTTQPLAQRMAKHRNDFKRFKEGKNKYRNSACDVLEAGNPKIVLIENFECKNKEELHKRERYFIDNNVCVNKIIPTRTQTEYSQTDDQRAKRQVYRDNHKDGQKAYMNDYRPNNRDRISRISKKYYHKIKDKRKETYNENKEAVLAKLKEHYQNLPKYMCVCGSQYNQKSKNIHLKSKKHQKFIAYPDFLARIVL